MKTPRPSILAIIGPGILVAATGVGAGDLATASIVGGKLGTAILWAVVIGACLKFSMTEGLARFQLATGSTLVEGCIAQFGQPIRYLFLIYLAVWSYFVGSALMSACGIASHAILPLTDPATDKIIYGIAHSLVAVLLVYHGGYQLFGKVMTVCIGAMFTVVMIAAIAVKPDWSNVLIGLTTPTIPNWRGEGLSWAIALIGGVGGTVTVLSYGYWIREGQREGIEALRTCRIDLAAGYTMTALFGIAMVIIGASLGEMEGKGTGLIVSIADHLEQALGGAGGVMRWAFLIGAWGAIFSSLLGVWQSIPYLFADVWAMRGSTDVSVPRNRINTTSRPYRMYLFAIAIIPAVGLWGGFVQVQKYYAIAGALFVPMLAVALLILNGKTALVGPRARNSAITIIVLLLVVALSLIAAWFELRKNFQ
jgi:Mn2+/Fe2+ NRAMP family transporter